MAYIVRLGLYKSYYNKYIYSRTCPCLLQFLIDKTFMVETNCPTVLYQNIHIVYRQLMSLMYACVDNSKIVSEGFMLSVN